MTDTREAREQSTASTLARDGTRRGKRIIADLPRWTSYDPDPARSRFQPGIRTGMGTAQCWCYLCSSEHRRDEPCVSRTPRPHDDPRLACVVCGTLFLPRSTRPHKFCTSACYTEARKARRRKTYDGRYE